MFGKFHLNSFSRQTFFIMISAKSVSKMDVTSSQNSVKYFCAVSTRYTPWEFKSLSCLCTQISVDFV